MGECTAMLGIIWLGTAFVSRRHFLDVQVSEALRFYAPSKPMCPFCTANSLQLKLLRVLPK